MDIGALPPFGHFVGLSSFGSPLARVVVQKLASKVAARTAELRNRDTS